MIDATLVERHKELRDQLAQQVRPILDPRTQPAATPGGFKPALAQLPWGEDRPHVLDDFRSLAGRKKSSSFAEYTVANGFTQVMAPTHVIASPNSPWLAVDLEATRWLRLELDRRGGKQIPIVYSLALAYSVFRDPEQRVAIQAAFRAVAARFSLAED